MASGRPVSVAIASSLSKDLSGIQSEPNPYLVVNVLLRMANNNTNLKYSVGYFRIAKL